MSKITVGIPPNFSPLLCKQKNWEKVDCQIEQHKKHTYNITTIGPFFFLNPTNKKNYPFMIFLPNYIPETLPKKCNYCTLSVRFPKPIPSITFLSAKEDQIREIYEYIITSKKEITCFLENVKISENITSDGFEQFSENFPKPIKIIPNIQFMNGKWQLQTLYKEQARELKTIQLESHNILAFPCFEVPHKFGSSETVINSFFVISKVDSLPIYFKTSEIDEMIKWILFIYAYLNNSPNAVGAPFSRIQSVPIKKSPSNLSQSIQSVSSQIQTPASIANANNNNEGVIQRSQTTAGNQSQKPKLIPPQRQPSNQAQKPRQTITSNPKQPSVTISTPTTSPTDQKKKSLEKKSGTLSSGNKSVSQANIKKPTFADPKSQLTRSQTNASQPPHSQPPTNKTNKSNLKLTKSSQNITPILASPTSTPTNTKSASSIRSTTLRQPETKKSDFFTDINQIPDPLLNPNPKSTNQNNPSESTNTTANEPTTKAESPKEDFDDFSFKFESLSIEDNPITTKNETSFPDVQFIDIESNDLNSQEKEEMPKLSAQSSADVSRSNTVSSTSSASGTRARSFSTKRRNSSISSQALDSIRSDKPRDVDNNDDYNIPSDMTSRIERAFIDLDSKYANFVRNDSKSAIFTAPNYNDIVSTTLVSMSTLSNADSRAMQIKTLMNTIDANEQDDFVDFTFVDQNDAETVEDTLNNMSSEDRIDLDSFFKFSEYPEYDVGQLTNSVRPKNTFIDEFTQIDQGLRQSGSSTLDLTNFYVVRLCFLVACTIVNGLKDFTDQSSTVSIVESLRQMSFILPDLKQIITEVQEVQTTCEQASIAATMLIRKNLLGAFLREVKRTDNWASKYYMPSAMLSSYEFLDTFVLMLEPMLNTLTFNVEHSSTIFKSASTDDVNRYAFTPLFAYLEIDDLFRPGADPVRIISKQFECGLKKSKKFLNLTAWDVLEKLSQDQRYSAFYYTKFMNSINASKAFFGSSKSKLESWINESISSKTINQFFMLVHINLTLLNSPDYYEEASLIDPFKANYIMKKLCKYISKP